MTLTVDLGERSYDVVVERGCLQRVGELLNLDRKVLIVTDTGIPLAYPEAVARSAKEACVVCFAAGEKSKNVKTWMTVLDRLLEYNFTRSDCVVAVGGGVVGDMAGFAAASYLRGIDFYNIPTTLLSQLDSSVGGKVGVDYKGYKNMVGAFYQPKKVIIDPDVLSTLDPRQLRAGAAEAVKIALTSDKELFELFESGKAMDQIETVIAHALAAKADVVCRDETEGGLRRVLNFGHTVGHAVESAGKYSLLHGECVALGMIPMAAPGVRARLLAVLENLGLPTRIPMDKEKILSAVAFDKKRRGWDITVVRCEEVGSYRFETLPLEAFVRELREVL